MLSTEFSCHSPVSDLANYELSLLSLVSFDWLGRAGHIDESESEPSLQVFNAQPLVGFLT